MIFVVPTATPVTKPLEEMVAVAGVSLVHVTSEVMSLVEPSVKIPVALNCCVAPTAKFSGEAGVTEIEDKIITVKLTGELDIPLNDAVIVTVPAVCPATTPAELKIAMSGALLTHVTWEVMSTVEPSANVPVAVKSWSDPTFRLAGLPGVISIDVKASTVRTILGLVTPPNDAEILAVPPAIPLANPPEETVAVAGVSLTQVT